MKVDASKFYKLTTTENEDGTGTTNTYVFNGDEAYSLLDNTIVHELMHVHMLDYTRSGMTGVQHNEKAGTYTETSGVEFPQWFKEGIATAVDNPYQYWNTAFKGYGYDSSTGEYSDTALQQMYQNNTGSIQLDSSNREGYITSDYTTGYLATVYLSYLAALAYDNKDAISGENGNTKIDSKVILSGMNHILSDLHDGKTLDQIIGEISPQDKINGQHYSGADDFANKFIATKSGEGSDGGSSAAFCALLLNYFESNSSEKGTVNGSVLLDFTNTQNYQLTKDLLKGKQTVYVIDGKAAESDVKADEALKSGGTSATGTASDSSGGGSSAEASQTSGEESAAKPASDNGEAPASDPAVEQQPSENSDGASDGSTIEQPSENTDNSGEDSSGEDSKPDNSSEKTPNKTSEESSEASSESSEEDSAPEDEAEFPVEEPAPQDPEPEPEPEEAATPEQEAAQEPAPAPEPEITPEPEPAPAEDYTPPSMIISEDEPEPAPEEQPNQDNNQEVLDAVKPEPSTNEESAPSESSGE